MNQSRLWTIAAVLLIVALLAGTWFLGVAPRLSDARDADTALDQAVALNNTHRQTLASLKAEHERIDEIRAELAEAHSVLPNRPNPPEILRTLDAVARQSGVVILDLTVSAASLYVVPDDAPAEFLSAANELAKAGLFVIPMKIEVEGSGTALLNFVSALQSTQRYFHVHQGEMLSENGVGVLTVTAEVFGISSDLAEREAPASSTPPTEPADS